MISQLRNEQNEIYEFGTVKTGLENHHPINTSQYQWTIQIYTWDQRIKSPEW
jgi:hypothetical protein